MQRTFNIFADQDDMVLINKPKLSSLPSAFSDNENLFRRTAKSGSSYTQHKKPLENVGNIIHRIQSQKDDVTSVKSQLVQLPPPSGKCLLSPSFNTGCVKKSSTSPNKTAKKTSTSINTANKKKSPSNIATAGTQDDEDQWPEPEYMHIENVEDDYEDIFPKSDRILSDKIYRMWDCCRLPLLSESSPSSLLSISPVSPVPDIEFPDIKLFGVDEELPLPTVSVPVWNDEDDDINYKIF